MSNQKWGRRKDTNKPYVKGSVIIPNKGGYDAPTPPTRTKKLQVKVMPTKFVSRNVGTIDYEFLQTNPVTGEQKWVENTGGGTRNIHMIPSEIAHIIKHMERFPTTEIRDVVVRVPYGKKQAMKKVLQEIDGVEFKKEKRTKASEHRKIRVKFRKGNSKTWTNVIITATAVDKAHKGMEVAIVEAGKDPLRTKGGMTYLVAYNTTSHGWVVEQSSAGRSWSEYGIIRYWKSLTGQTLPATMEEM